MLNGMPADSNKTDRYLMKFKRLTTSTFLSDADEISSSPSHIMTIEGNNILPIELKAFPSADTLIRYGITTNLVPDAIYDGGKNKLFEKIFVERNDFISVSEEK
jgi:hypothetical protein